MARQAMRLLVAALLIAAQPGWAQIVTENAGAISPETPILRESVELLHAEHLQEVRWNHQIRVSPDPSRELNLTVPFVWREVEFTGAAGTREEENLGGLGDITLRVKQSLWQRDEVMASTRLAAVIEVVAPSGEEDRKEDGVELPRRLQLGAGDWTVGIGGVFTWIQDRQRFSVEAFFRHRTRHDGVQLGETAHLNLAYWYRFTPAQFEAGREQTEVRGVIELLSTYRWESEVGRGNAGDDGAIVWLAPGVQVYPSKKVLLEANVQVPLFQNLDDAVGERDWGGLFAIKVLF